MFSISDKTVTYVPKRKLGYFSKLYKLVKKEKKRQILGFLENLKVKEESENSS